MGQPQHPKLPARWNAVGFMKRLSKRSLADRKGATQGRDMKRRIQISQHQRLGLLDKIAAGHVWLLGRPFRHSSDPSMDCHRKPPCHARQNWLLWKQHSTRRYGLILPFGAGGGCATACGSNAQCGSSISGLKSWRRARASSSTILRAPRWRPLPQRSEPAASPSPCAGEP